MERDRVVLVHGLWMNGIELSMLEHRLRTEHGFDVARFSYPTMQADAADVCARLAEFAGEGCDDPGRVHLVGHSLGGVLVHRMLSECGTRYTGHSVVLGAPLNGSRAAMNVARMASLRPLLGALALAEIAEARPRQWSGPAALGGIAGTVPMGTGQFFAHFDEPHDGTVGVSETQVPGLADHIVVPHSHFGMLLSRDVAAQVAHFLREGRFRH
jgi:pimeloyl-ACP methyl ester carboxylesterase